MARRRTMLSADGKAVWSWHPLLVLNLRRRVGPTGLRQTFNPLMTVTRRIRSPGRARNKPLKPLRAGMPGDSGGPVVNTRVLSTNAHEAAGASGTRHSPRPHDGGNFLHSSGTSRRENAEVRPNLSVVIVCESGRSSIPGASVIEPR